MSKIEEVKINVQKGKTKVIAGLVQEALDAGEAAADILQAMVEAMEIVGDQFSRGEIFVPEMLVAGKAMQKGMEVLKPVLAGENPVFQGKCIIGTVAGDLHDIGKNLVALMIEGAGFEVIDLGVDVPVEKFIEAIKENPDVKVVALSALLSTTMPAMKETVKAIKESGLTGFKVIVGGAPITSEFAAAIGADAYARDAGSAVVKIKEII
ncbi:MAG TPA: cobalamin-binding protein [Firmicutes bacterium]|nr:cobalamin-binding protein [Bacillota bacterium]